MPLRFSTFALIFLATSNVSVAGDDDPYIWLEEVENEKALEWAKSRSDEDTAVLEAVPEYGEIHAQLLEIYNSQERIPTPGIRGDWVYNFWRDADHVRGIWRRTSLSGFTTDDPDWETVLDVDAIAEADGENWVWKGATCLAPEHRHCMILLSRGGADATIAREFDTAEKAFVADGFALPEAKLSLNWKDANTLWVGTDFGEGSLTSSGYPRFAREWQRGTALQDARTVFEASVDDVSAGAYSSHTATVRYDIVTRVPEFFRGTTFLMLGGRLVRLDLPEDADFRGFFKDQLLVSLRTDWHVDDATYPQGALLAIALDDFLAGSRSFDVLFTPEERTSLRQVRWTANHLVYAVLDNVRAKLFRLTPTDAGWSREEIAVPGIGTVTIGSTSENTDDFFFTYTDFVTPTSLYLVRGTDTPMRVKSTPDWFDTAGMKVAQHEATSRDGTRIPYFLVTPRGFEADGSSPTVISAYGGFEISRLSRYNATVGTAWISRGGVYVVANIRGGGEFGPKWHQAAVKEKHQNNFDDLIAVAEDLIERKITSPDHLGIIGGSQGGLLVGGAFVQRPELFSGVVSAIPLFDMKRFNKLLAGASWMAEYGNPDTDDWEFMKLWSPYQNLEEDADYPAVFFWTNTRDDRVHPAHARKAVARMTDMGHKVFYYENTEGGHGSGADLNARAYTNALSYAYFWLRLR
jgi:prolyl oligopeptidase